MKKIVIISFILFFCITSISSQSCLPEDITFNTQAQIDSFQINFPGCTEIEGDVLIRGNDIINLDALSVITGIGGSLWIGRKPGYGDTTAGNPLLISLTGLNNLNRVGGSWMSISTNGSIQDLSGLEQLDSCGGILWISNNQSLQDLTGLTNLNFADGCMIGNNESLTSLMGMNSLDSLSGYLGIVYNNSLTSLTGLENLVYTEGAEISANALLTSLTGLDNIEAESISNIIITDNALLFECEVQSICDYLASPGGTIENTRLRQKLLVQ